MSLPFFESSSSRLDELVRPGMLCAFDFDGTLAPIVKEAWQARIPAPVARRLCRLAELADVAIISGRAAADVQARLDFVPKFVVGNHGLEGVPGLELSSEGNLALCRRWERTLSAAFGERNLSSAGIRLENKGYSLSVHYRMARDRPQAERQLAELLALAIPEAHIIGGKCVFNLLPRGGLNKGGAFDRLMEVSGAGSAIYVGDDITDEDVFRLRRRDVLSVRVEPGIHSAAEFYLHHRLGMLRLLDELIRRLCRCAEPAQA